jgi:hypothetical protein
MFVGDLQRIAESGSGDQRGSCTLAFDQRIGGKRRAMNHQLERRRRNTRILQYRLCARDHRLVRCSMRRKQFRG